MRRVAAEAAFFLLVWLVVLALFRERAFYDPGSLWHVVVGEIIMDHGMPQTDPFSYTCAGERWVPQQWGAEVLMALLHRLGGRDLLYLAFATGIAATATWLFHRTVQAGMGPWLAGMAIGGCLFVGAFHYYVRPHMVTLALTAWTMAALADWEERRANLWRLVGLVPLFVLWTNLHGGVIGGIVMLGVAAAGWISIFVANRGPVATPRPTPIDSWRTAGVVAMIAFACTLAPLVNPHGWEMIRIWRTLIGSPVLPQVVGEHVPMRLTNPLAWPVLGLAAVYGLLLVGAWPRQRLSWWIPLVWLVLSFKGIRQAPLFAASVAAVLPAVWPHTVWYRWLRRYGDGTLADEPRPRPVCRPMWLPPVAAVATALAVQFVNVPVPLLGVGWARLSPYYSPVDIHEALLAAAERVPPGTPIFNDANFGGYLIYFTPQYKIFMDDRCELYGDARLAEYVAVLSLPPDELGEIFEQWQQRYGFQQALVATTVPPQKKPSLEQYLLSRPDRWREVARGRCAVLFERVAEPSLASQVHPATTTLR